MLWSLARRLPAALDSSFSVDTTSTFVLRSAGATPINAAVAIEAPTANDSSFQSKGMLSPSCAPAAGMNVNSTPAAQRENRRPAPAPSTAKIKLSTSSCRTRCQRAAPIEILTAISRRRPSARASSMFPTFAQARSRTTPASAANTSSTGRSSCAAPNDVLHSGSASTVRARFTSG